MRTLRARITILDVSQTSVTEFGIKPRDTNVFQEILATTSWELTMIRSRRFAAEAPLHHLVLVPLALYLNLYTI